MGQNVAMGVLYGVEAKSVDEGGPLLYWSDAEEPKPGTGLMDRWEKTPKKFRGKHAIVTTEEGGVYLVGFWVALLGGDDAREHPGAVCIAGEATQVEDLKLLPNYRSAQEAWERFRVWAVGQGWLGVGVPRLWFAPTEVS